MSKASALTVLAAICFLATEAYGQQHGNAQGHGPKASSPPTPEEIAAKKRRHDMGLAHGILMCIAFSFLYPMGAVFVRLYHGTCVAWLHGGIQLIAFTLTTIGFGLGVYISSKGGHGTLTSHNGHKQIGLTCFIIMFLMPFAGAIHHAIYKRNAKAHREDPSKPAPGPTWISRIHVNIGRLVVIMGGINVGLGVMLAYSDNVPRVVGYAVPTAMFFSLYFFVLAQRAIAWHQSRSKTMGKKESEGRRESAESQPNTEASLTTVETGPVLKEEV